MARLTAKDVNFRRCFEAIPTITGIAFKRHRDRWYAPVYMDGSPHQEKRWDKLTVRIKGEHIQFLEQGGESGISLQKWLVTYAGCKNYQEAYRQMIECSGSIIIPPPRSEPPMRYVYPSVLLEAKNQIGVLEDALFTYLCTLFDRDKVVAAYHRFNIVPVQIKQGVATCFFYVNEQGQILHDKLILYGSDGKRIHSYGGGRKYRTDEGYRGRCLFNSHLLANRRDGEPCYVFEGEKVSLLAELAGYDGIFLSTGGLNCLRDIKPDYILGCDRDGLDLWASRYPNQIWQFWKDFPEYPCGDKDDFGDFLLWRAENARKTLEIQK